MSLAEKGDRIIFNTDAAKDAVVTWSQDWEERSTGYVSMPYVVLGKEAGSALFVQATFLLKFSEICKDGPSDHPLFGQGYKHEVQINDDFQYGQNEGRTNRFLVYHDKNNRAYQHRFTGLPVFVSALKNLSDIATMLPIPYVGKLGGIPDLVQSFVGDYLHDF